MTSQLVECPTHLSQPIWTTSKRSPLESNRSGPWLQVAAISVLYKMHFQALSNQPAGHAPFTGEAVSLMTGQKRYHSIYSICLCNKSSYWH